MVDIIASINVGLKERSYPIFFGWDLLGQLKEKLSSIQFPRKIALVTSPNLYDLFGRDMFEHLSGGGYECTPVIVPEGEEHKTFATLEKIYDQLIECRFDRGSGLIALGGGVIGDMAGYAAATFLRGIPFVQIPTTLLSQVDSSVGGKTAVNHPLGKNLIGAFYQPKLVLIDIDTLNTLDPREVRAGLAEVVKYGVIRDAEFFGWLELNMQRLLDLEPEALIYAVKRSCQIKADIVENDEREGSVRALLNFGHTFGHAIETLCGYGKWRHGEAVACGMVIASRISQMQGLSSESDCQRIVDLLRRFELPIKAPAFPLSEYIAAMQRDKKVKGGTLTLVLNQGLGSSGLYPVDNVEQIFKAVLPELEG